MESLLPENVGEWNENTIQKLIEIEYEESQFLEFKKILEILDKSKKKNYKIKIEELITSFANSKGGFILFGMTNDRHIEGIIIADDEESNLKISQILSNVVPPVSFETKIININSKKILLVKVNECLDKPIQCSNGSFHIRLSGQTIRISRDNLRDMFLTKEIKKQKYERLVFEIDYMLKVIEQEDKLSGKSILPPFYKLRVQELQESLSDFYGYLNENIRDNIGEINNKLAEIKQQQKYFEMVLLVQSTKNWGISFCDLQGFLQDSNIMRDFGNINTRLHTNFQLLKDSLLKLKEKLKTPNN